VRAAGNYQIKSSIREKFMTIYSAIGFAVAVLVLAASPGPGVFATVATALASVFRSSVAVLCEIDGFLR
jgi:hypothetical protein